MATDNRPLSPHLQIYKPQLTSVLSILHRLTGVVDPRLGDLPLVREPAPSLGRSCAFRFGSLQVVVELLEIDQLLQAIEQGRLRRSAILDHME